MDQCLRCKAYKMSEDHQEQDCPNCTNELVIPSYVKITGAIDATENKKYQYLRGLTFSIRDDSNEITWTEVVYENHPLYEQAKELCRGDDVTMQGFLEDGVLEIIEFEL